MKKIYKVLCVVLIGIMFTGCATSGQSLLNPETSVTGGGRVTSSSANQIMSEGFEFYDDEKLFSLLDPENKSNLQDKSFSTLTEPDKAKFINLAFFNANKFYEEKHRSQIQDQLKIASDQRCNLYNSYLKRISTYYNASFGVLSTIFGGVGAIVTGNASRLLSGMAGISSGVKEELSQSLFSSITTSVIVPGIEKKREEIWQGILKKRNDKLDTYTVQGAIADVIIYHGACKIDTGLDYAQKTIQLSKDAGLTQFQETMKKLGYDVKVAPSDATDKTKPNTDNVTTDLSDKGKAPEGAKSATDAGKR
ncbi:hypothetical protein [Candidatus Magnetominusculus xianensis]|uniref:Lipoprotein n=1 Tax=Candidatus Magnetominusculus xianensis TaxID=1748249 RepID=A0ABR5SFQ2_9BACT|nr:hypothetical protein [Candidatus Magnetominusculus xianensis]KWT86784.1 hypothetical protein ASN18_1507 [Candidatus Magnetominusculus xianensis]MBF0402498.1 hypothetical protein [Nitrospirota bacterium]